MLDQGLISIVTNIVSVGGALTAVWIGSHFGRSNDRKKKIRESLEEVYVLSSQIRTWVHVTIRRVGKGYEWDYFHDSIPAEYLLEETAKEPPYPLDRIQMLIDFDIPSLKTLLAEYISIVSLLRDIKYVYEDVKSASTLDYYLSGVIYDKVEKHIKDEITSGADVLRYIATRFDTLHDEIGTSLSKMAQKN
jgi:hypothetical protein